MQKKSKKYLQNKSKRGTIKAVYKMKGECEK